MKKNPIITIDDTPLSTHDLSKEGVTLAHQINDLVKEIDELHFYRIKALRFVYQCDDQREKADLLYTGLVAKLKSHIESNSESEQQVASLQTH